MAVTYISWAPHCSRSDYTARELGGVSHMVYVERLGSNLATIWLKYLIQAYRTWKILLRGGHDAVFVMSPPLVAGLVVIPYCWLRRIPLVVDAHTGAFLNPRWRHLQWMQHWLCRQAATTIVTNTHLATALASQGADATILPDVPIRYPEADGPALLAETGRFRIAVICSFGRDEPVELIMKVARALPEVQFLVTGNPKRVERLKPQFSANLVLTGFLDNTRYGQLLREADLVMALTTSQYTMLRAAYEAVYHGTPVIVSDSPVLREEFNQGGFVVRNTVEDIVHAVMAVQRDPQKYRRDVSALRERKERRWERNKQILLAKLGRDASSRAVHDLTSERLLDDEDHRRF
jgi:glycosyltransferase involved in cell wall biosynthesis